METTALKEGAYVIAAYVGVFYLGIIGQAITQKRLLFAYKARGERFERFYNVMDKSMLGWDRVVGNFLEQAVPFLTLFMTNVALAMLNATSYKRIISAGWVYVAFRAFYPVAWFSGGGGRAGARPMILTSTLAMYAVILFLFINMLQTVNKF